MRFWPISAINSMSTRPARRPSFRGCANKAAAPIDPAAMKEFPRDQPIGPMGRADEVAAAAP